MAYRHKFKFILNLLVSVSFLFTSDTAIKKGGNYASCLGRFDLLQVVLTNQITTRFDGKADFGDAIASASDSAGRLVPALGESWGHICSVRVFLTRLSGQKRQIRLLKHPGQPFGTGIYEITTDGIRDCPN